jgi:GAF domain-containing protein
MSAQMRQELDNTSDEREVGLGEPSDLPRMLLRIAQTTRHLFAADVCAISAINPLTRRFVSPLTTADADASGAAALDQSPLQAIMQYVLEQQVVFIEDVPAHTEYQRLFAAIAGIRSFAALVLRGDDDQRAIAVLCLLFRTPRQFTDEQRKLLFLSTDAAVQSIRDIWLMQRYRVVARIGQEINQELETVELLFKKLQSHVSSILDASHFFLLAVYRPQSNSLDLYMSDRGAYSSRQKFPLTGGCKYVIEEQRALVINHRSALSSEQAAPVIPAPGMVLAEESLIFVPLSLRDVPYGVLSIQHLEPDVYDAEDVHILQLLGNYVALALSNIRLYDHVRRLNEAGQFLTKQLDTGEVLEGVVEQIRLATRADIVTLYPYDEGSKAFDRSPRLSGDLLKPGLRPLDGSRSDDIASLMIDRLEPIFVESARLYEVLSGGQRERQGDFAQREQISSTAALPLRVGDEPVGVLFVNFRQAQRFDAPQKQLISGLASYTAIAIKNSREFGDAARRHLQYLQLLRQIDREISKTLDLEVVMQTILNMATEHIPVDAASIMLYNPQTKILRMEAAVGRHIQFKQVFKLHTDENRGITSRVFKNKQPMRVGNVQTDPDWRDIYVEAAIDTLSELDVPLLKDDQAIGVINFESLKEDAFSQADEDFLVTLADRAVLAVANAQMYEREKRTVEERQALVNIGGEIIREFDTRRIFNLILEKALDVTRSQVGTLRLYDAQRNDLWIAAERGVRKERKQRRIKMGRGIIGWVARDKKPLNIGDVSAPDWAPIFLHSIPDIRSELAVPLLEGDRLHGVLNIESRDPENFDDDDLSLLTALADLSVIALQTAERYKRAEDSNALQMALYEVDRTIIGQVDNYDQVMETILRYASRLTGAKIADLALYEGDTLITIYQAHRDERGQVPPIRPISAAEALDRGLKQGIILHVATTREPYRTHGDAQRDQYYKGDAAIHSEVAVPLLAGGDRLIGVLNVESKHRHAFNDQSMLVLQSLARQAVIAIQSAQNYANAEIERLRFKLLHKVGQELAKISDLAEMDQAYEAVIQIAEQHFKSHVVIRRYDELARELVLMLPERYRTSMARIPLDDSLSGLVAKTRRTHIVHNVNAPGVPRVQPAYPDAQSLVIAPIVFKERYYGNLGFSRDKIDYFQDTDVELIEGLAQQLAITIHRLETAQAQQVAEQRAKEAEIMASIGKANFDLAHRLGNDLGLVNSYVNNIHLELEKHNIENAELADNLDKIVADVGLVLGLSTTLKRDLAGFREGGQRVRNHVKLPVSVLLEDTRLALPPTPPQIQLDWQIAEGTACVQVVPGEIIDIFVNLIMNAVAAMPGGGTITIGTHTAERSIEFAVADTGVGIEPERQSQIFDLFYTTKDKEGSGFGLWSARHNALANGGELSVHSTPGQGTTFTLRLPRLDCDIEA